MPILTIDSARLNGTPSAGTVRITASRSPLMDSGSNTVYSGTQTFPLDAQGKLSVSLPATDSPSIGPFTYIVEANLASGQWIYRGVKLPASVATIDITDAQSASQQMYPTRQEWDAITAGMNTAIEGKVDGPGMTLRRDNTAATRIFLDRPDGSTMLYGDTGWRDVSDSLENGWTGTLHVRRQTSDVLLRATGLSGATATSGVVYTLPQGMIDGLWRNVHVYDSVGDKVLNLNFYPKQFQLPVRPEKYFSEGFVEIHVARISHVQPWPTTLPGTPAA